jgi:hypothetical protein
LQKKDGSSFGRRIRIVGTWAACWWRLRYEKHATATSTHVAKGKLRRVAAAYLPIEACAGRISCRIMRGFKKIK